MAVKETGPVNPEIFGNQLAAVNMPSAPLFCGNLDG